MGVVHVAVDLQTGREVAIKICRIDEHRRQEARTRFDREVRVVSRLQHPNIVALHDWGESDAGEPYFVMNRLHGTTLGQLLRARGTLGVGELLRITLPLMGALSYAHDRGVVHRDIKPENIFLGRADDGAMVPTLLDFGIAVGLSSARLTRSGVIVGTAPYISPEQAADLPISEQTDVWSMAVVLYRCLAGAPPFQGADVPSTLIKIIKEPAPALCARAPDVDARIAAVVDRALSRGIERRFASMRDLAQALQAAATAQAISLPTDPDPIGLQDWRQWGERSERDDEATVRIERDAGH